MKGLYCGQVGGRDVVVHFPFRFYTLVCPRCLAEFSAHPRELAGPLLHNEAQGNRYLATRLALHRCAA